MLARLFALALGLPAVLVMTGCGGSGERPAGTGRRPIAQRSSSAAPISGAPCPEARRFTCGRLVVPLDHDAPLGARLSLRVAVQKGPAPRGVLVLLSGGPGQPEVPFVPRVSRRLARPARGWRLVAFDQRGTGSGALGCTALQRARGASDLTPPPAGAVADCARSLGAKRRFFTTADTVADIEALRVRLGVRRIALYGVSYGTFVAERYALAHPGHVRALVLDSVVPQEGVDALGVDVLHRAATVLRSVCARCASDAARVVRRGAGGIELLDTLVSLSVGESSFRGVPAALHAAARGDDARLRRLEARVHAEDALPAAALSQGLHQATLCAEMLFPWSSPAAPLAGRRRLAERVVARVPAARLWPFDRETVLRNGFLSGCLDWPSERIDQFPADGDLPAVPTLLLAGGRDLSTPLVWAQREQRHSAAARLIVIPDSGHGVLRQDRSGRARAALAQVLADA